MYQYKNKFSFLHTSFALHYLIPSTARLSLVVSWLVVGGLRASLTWHRTALYDYAVQLYLFRPNDIFMVAIN